MKEVPVSTDILNVYGEMGVFFSSLKRAGVNRPCTLHDMRPRKKPLFLALNSRHVVQLRERMDVVACRTFL